MGVIRGSSSYDAGGEYGNWWKVIGEAIALCGTSVLSCGWWLDIMEVLPPQQALQV